MADNYPKKNLVDEACKIVYLNYGKDTAQLYRAGLKNKAEKEILASLEESLKALIGPENAESQLEKLKNKYKHTLKP
jgi:regulator of sirC expression with transglutaminase-like and TPR domain